MALNLVKTPSRNYAGVQQQILDLVRDALPPGSYTESLGERREGSLNFGLFIHQPADVVMSHGVADKNYFLRKDEDGQRIANRLAHVLVPGEWLRQRLLRSPHLQLQPEQIHPVGWPRLDVLLALQKEMPTDPAEGRRKRVLWAPTHDYARRGDEQLSLSSFPEFEQYLPQLERHCDVQVSLHPRNRRDKIPTSEKLLWADYVVSDFGTLVYEAWTLGKPVLFPDWIIRDRILAHLPSGCAERVIFRDRIGLHTDSFQALLDGIMSGVGMDAASCRFLNQYVAPEYHGCSARRVADLLIELDEVGLHEKTASTPALSR